MRMRKIDALWSTREIIRSGQGNLERKRDTSLQLLGEAVYRRIIDGDGRSLVVDESMCEVARAILACDVELAEMKDRQRSYDREIAEDATREAIANAAWAMMDDDRDELTFICPNCFTRTSLELEYCIGCGQPVEKLVLQGARLRFQEQLREDKVSEECCPRCGSPLPTGSNRGLFCVTCGAKLVAPGADAPAGTEERNA